MFLCVAVYIGILRELTDVAAHSEVPKLLFFSVLRVCYICVRELTTTTHGAAVHKWIYAQPGGGEAICDL